MHISGQYFSPSILDQIRETVKTEPFISRLNLSRKVCEWLNWKSPNGRPKDMSCRKALNKLNKSGIIALPANNNTYAFEHTTVNSVKYDIHECECTLEELEDIHVYPVSSRYAKESKIWFSLLDNYHYLGSGSICGNQIRYLIKSSRGYLGALSFSSASWALKARDDYIEWTEGARRAHIDKVICNSRFLILPAVHVPNLASHVLSLAVSRIVKDWEERYNVSPVLVETFVDPLFAGTCYKAANFTCAGDSAGRRDGIPKKIFLYPLNPQWKDILCNEPRIYMPRPDTPRHWAEEEFGTIRFFDDRLKERLYTIACDFYNNPVANIPEACGSKARTTGAYRFFQNKKATMETILNPHTEATVERIRQYSIVLAPQDTTTLNYNTHATGLGPINNKDDKAVGLLLHDTLAFTEEGTPLGILDAQCWARDPDDTGKSAKRRELPIEQKESMKWLRSFRKVSEIQKLCPETMIVSMGDRESDIYELFLEAVKEKGPALLVRAEKTRRRKVDQEFLWDLMIKKDSAGSMKIHIPRNGSVKARDAVLDIRFAGVKLNPPKGYTTPVTVWAVYVLEKETEDPLEWMLLTTVPVHSFDDAVKRVEWYSGRWGIEVYHRTLKSGCRIEGRQLEEADRLETCLAIDMVVAWRIYYLTMLGREVPDQPCTIFFKDIEWKALCCFVNKTPVVPDKPPTIRQAVFMVAGMGGHLGRKGDGFPGTQTIWLGIIKLYGATQMYAILTKQPYYHPLQSGP